MKAKEARGDGIGAMYSRRAEGNTFGPPTYTSQELLQKICDATGLAEAIEPLTVLDSMSGPGLLSMGLQKLAPQHRYYNLDLVASQLVKIPNSEGKVAGNALRMPFKKGSFIVGVVRYAAKDVPQDQQPELFQQMFEITAPGGRWVLADMYAPLLESASESRQVYKWLNYQHAAKQERSGRNRQEGTCHIPTEKGWLELFRKTRFRAEVVDQHMSFVTTTDWLTSNQVTEQQLVELNHIILTAPQSAKRAFNIRQEGESVKIDYPVTIIRAIKP